ncbi:MAG: hypothetical protein II238_00445 [Alphaproteobacteria bacterium]|nr:hypothetical protein [Alphaproteobacteria bacterium]
MANEQNLIPMNQRTKTEQREIAIAGGIASGEARRKKREIAEIARMVLEQQVTDVSDYDYGAVPVKEATVAELIMAVHANKALKGDKESAKLVLESAKSDKKATMLGGFQFVVEPGDDEI